MTMQEHGSVVAEPTTTREARGWFLAAAVVLVLGLVTAAVWSGYGVLVAREAPEDFARTSLPGTLSVHVAEAGTQWLYYEHPAGTPTPSLQTLRVRVSAPAGAAGAPEPTRLTLQYDLHDGELGTAVGTFAATVPGVYTVTASGRPDQASALAVGPDVALPLWTPLLGGAAVVVLSFMVAVGLALAGLGGGGRSPRPRSLTS